MNSRVHAYKPGDGLSSFVEMYWEGNFNDCAHGPLAIRVIPSGFVELIIHRTKLHCDLQNHHGWSQSPDYTIIGLYTSPYQVKFSSNVKVFGIRFKPEGIYNIFGVPASKLKGNYEDMSLIIGNRFKSFCNQLRDKKSSRDRIALTDNYLIKTAQSSQFELSYVNRAAEIIRKTKGTLKIDDLSSKMCISLRQLEREFKDKVGITPKQYLRISRLNHVQRLLENQNILNLTEIAHQSGYTDQAHFIRDFKSIIGEKPTIFVKDAGEFLINPAVENRLQQYR